MTNGLTCQYYTGMCHAYSSRETPDLVKILRARAVRSKFSRCYRTAQLEMSAIRSINLNISHSVNVAFNPGVNDSTVILALHIRRLKPWKKIVAKAKIKA